MTRSEGRVPLQKGAQMGTVKRKVNVSEAAEQLGVSTEFIATAGEGLGLELEKRKPMTLTVSELEEVEKWLEENIAPRWYVPYRAKGGVETVQGFDTRDAGMSHYNTMKRDVFGQTAPPYPAISEKRAIRLARAHLG
jgi:hypothetical protein